MGFGCGYGQGAGAISQVENQQNLVTTWVNEGGGEETGHEEGGYFDLYGLSSWS